MNKKGMKNKFRNIIFLLFSSSRVDLFVKKQNCRNLSLINLIIILQIYVTMKISSDPYPWTLRKIFLLDSSHWARFTTLCSKQSKHLPAQIIYQSGSGRRTLPAPAVQAIWNLCLSTQRWPSAWKQAKVYPLPKVDIPVQPQDFRGICVTPVTART